MQLLKKKLENKERSQNKIKPLRIQLSLYIFAFTCNKFTLKILFCFILWDLYLLLRSL